MSFPQVAATNHSSVNTNVTSHTVSLALSPAAGDLLLLFFANDGSANVSLSGWTELGAIDNGSLTVRLTVFAKISDGTEGATVSVSSGATAEESSHVVYKVTGWRGASLSHVAISAGATGNSQSPNPGSVTPSWGAEDTLFIAAAAWDANTTEAVSAYPANYTANQVTDTASVDGGGCGIAVASRELNATSDDPGVFSIDTGANDWAAFTVAVRPAAALSAGPTLYFLNSATGDGWGAVQVGGTAPAASTMATGWTVGSIAADNYSEMAFGTERGTGTFSGTAAPASTPNNTLKNGWRYGPTQGVHAAGDWPISLAVRAVDAGGTQDGALRVRMFSSDNADGSSPTELTAGAVQLSTVTNLTTSADQVCSGTLTSIPQIPAGKYVFFCCAWRITGAAS